MKVLHECLDNDSPHLICKHCGAVGRCEKDDPPMPPQTKALALALAILREHNAWHIAQDKDGSYDDSGLQEQTLAAIHALEQEAAQPVQSDDWRQYATEREDTAQQVIERHRAEHDALLRLLAADRKTIADLRAAQPVQAAPSLVNDSLTTAAPVSAEDAREYLGVRCQCILTGCRAGPGCPHYGFNCRKHIDHHRAALAAKGAA